MAQHPLGLPKGSIRSIVALSVVGSCIAMMIMGKEIPSPMAAIAGLVIAHYFDKRAEETKTEG